MACEGIARICYPPYLCPIKWHCGRVARLSSAKAATAVRIRSMPPRKASHKTGGFLLFMVKKILLTLARLGLALVQLMLLAIILYRVMPVPGTPLMVQRKIEHSGSDFQIQKNWTPIEEMGKNLPHFAVTSEDPKFFKHWGFDFEQIQHAVSDNMDGRRLRGASTISQQTAKNLLLLPVRSFIRKGMEAIATVMMELLWNKKRILEVYLNIIETGNGIFGMEAAAQFYFKKPANKVSKVQAASMIAVLPNPIRWRPNKPAAIILVKRSKLQYLRQFVPVEQFYWFGK